MEPETRDQSRRHRYDRRPEAVLLLSLAALCGGMCVFPAHAQTPAGLEGHTVSVNGMDMYYETAGSGPWLLLLHPGMHTSSDFHPLVDSLGAHFRLVIPDLRGHGRSANPGGEMSTRQFARDVTGLLDLLGAERYSAIGASAGAMTLLHMATQSPERVEAMVVVGVGPYIPASCREVLAQTDGDAYPEAYWQRLRTQHLHGDEQIRALFGWIASLAESTDDMSFTPPQLATISARTLVVHGDRDYCFPASMAWDIYSAIPDAYLWVVPNGGHVPIYGPNAALFGETALTFLSGGWEG